MGIAGKNREGMRKYRRFVENPKETAVGSAIWVCATPSRRRFSVAAARLPPTVLPGLVSAQQTSASPSCHAMSRCHGAFLLILSERARQYRHFCRRASLSA